MSRITLGVSGVALDAGKVLLVRRGRGAYIGCWSLPGGRVNPMEPHREALMREFAEETGLKVEVGRLAGVAEAIDPNHGWHYLILSYFVAVNEGTLKAGDDADEVRWVDRDGLPELELTPGLVEYLEHFGCWSG